MFLITQVFGSKIFMTEECRENHRRISDSLGNSSLIRDNGGHSKMNQRRQLRIRILPVAVAAAVTAVAVVKDPPFNSAAE